MSLYHCVAGLIFTSKANEIANRLGLAIRIDCSCAGGGYSPHDTACT